ncbi:hypothetical protein [Streptomyces sp. DH-12]|uniref:hypothetical protein n=1 Tax=Streptomyces sp. DH-12 TaxID=2072509 RepID=UPI0013005514|nr:hypothetical protein [Streptomyces sp. DH-12]
MSGRRTGGPDGSKELSLSEAASEARALAARGDVTVEDVVHALRSVREARERT